MQQVRRDLVAFGDRVRVEAFSSLKGVGIDRLVEVLTEWYFADAAAELNPVTTEAIATQSPTAFMGGFFMRP